MVRRVARAERRGAPDDCRLGLRVRLEREPAGDGEKKVDALRGRLLEINPAAEVVAEARKYSAETAATFDLDGYDYVVDAIDSLQAKAHLINAVTRLERPVLISSMGAARKTDPFRIRRSEFWKVQGDGLARALRRRFRQLGEFPAKKFTCVWSDELPAPLGEGGALGSAVHVTAMFGFALAGLVLRTAVASFPSCAARGNVQ